MLQTVRTLTQLCTFRGTPADLPYKKETLVGVLVAHALFSLSVYFQNGKLSYPIVFYLITLAIEAAVVGTVLQQKRMLGRWLQLAIAMLGVDLLFYALVEVVSLLMRGGIGGIGMQVAFVLGVYRLFINAYIFAKGFEWKIVQGLLFAFMLQMIQGICTFGFINVPEGM